MLEARVEPEILLWSILESVICHHGAEVVMITLYFRLAGFKKYILIWNFFLTCGLNNEYD